MTTFLAKFSGLYKLQNTTTEFDVTNIKITNAPVTNNSNTDIIARNSATGNLEIVAKSSIVGQITVSNPSVTVGNRPVLSSPGTFSLPTNITFNSLLAGTGVVLNTVGNDITISAPNAGTSTISTNAGTGVAITTAVTNLALPNPGTPINFKGLTAGAGISIVAGATTVTISNTASNVNLYTSDGIISVTRDVQVNADLQFRRTVGTPAGITFLNMSTYNILGAGSYLLTANSTATINSAGSILLQATSLLNLYSTDTINIGNGLVGADTINVKANHIITTTPDFRLVSTPNTKQTNALFYNTGTGLVTQYVMTPYYGTLVFSSQVVSVTSAAITGISAAGSVTNASPNVVISGSAGIQYTGATNQQFEITFVGTFSVVTGSQTISVAIMKNNIEVADTKNTITFGAASGNLIIATLPNTISMVTNDIISLGFARSTTNTNVTFTGNVYLRNILAA